jgi:hypothetical protein
MRNIVFAANAIAACMAVLVGGCATLNPQTPPLLRGVTTGHGGWASGGCPPTANFEYNLERIGQEASSPELAKRLSDKFPAGTSSKALIAYLSSQGFASIAACQNDGSIFRMSFNQSGGSPLGPFPMLAVVAWKEDGQGRIVWTKGQVSFTGL